MWLTVCSLRHFNLILRNLDTHCNVWIQVFWHVTYFWVSVSWYFEGGPRTVHCSWTSFILQDENTILLWNITPTQQYSLVSQKTWIPDNILWILQVISTVTEISMLLVMKLRLTELVMIINHLCIIPILCLIDNLSSCFNNKFFS